MKLSLILPNFTEKKLSIDTDKIHTIHESMAKFRMADPFKCATKYKSSTVTCFCPNLQRKLISRASIINITSLQSNFFFAKIAAVKKSTGIFFYGKAGLTSRKKQVRATDWNSADYEV